MADAAEMVGVLSGEAIYAYTGGTLPGLDELRARYAGQAAGPPPGDTASSAAAPGYKWIRRVPVRCRAARPR